MIDTSDEYRCMICERLIAEDRALPICDRCEATETKQATVWYDAATPEKPWRVNYRDERLNAWENGPCFERILEATLYARERREDGKP